MDIAISFLLLIIAVGLFIKRPIKIEIRHTHVIEQEPVHYVQDPNDTGKPDPEIEKSMNTVIQSINAIMNGGEFPDGER